MYGHGGFFKTKDAGQRIMSAAIGEPVTVMATAGEGGAWGIALLALYAAKEDKSTLAEFLQKDIFGGEEGESVMADKSEIDGMNAFMDAFKKSMPVERAAVESF